LQKLLTKLTNVDFSFGFLRKGITCQQHKKKGPFM
jgi:hypothetical protein